MVFWQTRLGDRAAARLPAGRRSALSHSSRTTYRLHLPVGSPWFEWHRVCFWDQRCPVRATRESTKVSL